MNIELPPRDMCHPKSKTGIWKVIILVASLISALFLMLNLTGCDEGASDDQRARTPSEIIEDETMIRIAQGQIELNHWTVTEMNRSNTEKNKKETEK